MIRNTLKGRKALLALGDYILLFGALFLALKARFFFSNPADHYSYTFHAEYFFPLFFFWILLFYLFDLYDLKKIRSYIFTLSALFAALGTAVILSAIFFYFLPKGVNPKTILFFTAGSAFVVVGIWRYIWFRVFQAFQFKKNIVIVGTETAQLMCVPEILAVGDAHYTCKGFISIDAEGPLDVYGLQVLGTYKKLSTAVTYYKIDDIVTAFDYRAHPDAAREVSECLDAGVKIWDLPLFYEYVIGKVPIAYIDQLWFLYNIEMSKKILNGAQRITDIFLSLFGILLFVPFFPFVVFAIAFDSGWPIFYTQARVGKKGKIFNVYKFRTMVRDAERVSGPAWARVCDPRITRAGGFLRKTRIDEIPQLINILKGDMSFVGPRPERPEFVNTFKEEIPFYNRRHSVLPGLTGWAQVMYIYTASRQETLEKLQYDLYYIKNRSFLLYMIILLRTVRIVLTRKGV
jgi:sugar transferase (PEP-CTERM system associated)